MDDLQGVADDDFCYLTTRGRRTGAAHEIEIWFALEQTTLYMLAGGRDRSDWVRNIAADSTVSVRLRERTHSATARVLKDDGAESELARRLVFEKYQPRYSGSLENWRRDALPVAIDLAAGADRPGPTL